MTERMNAKSQDSEKDWVNRRSSPRFSPSAIPSLKSARLVAGPEVQLLNISRGGALLETEARMMPGAVICIRLVAADVVFLLRGRVLRSRASMLRGPALIYESAVAFEEPFPLLHDNNDSTGTESTPEENASSIEDLEFCANKDQQALVEEEQPSIYTVTASVPSSGPDLRQIFGLNNW